MGAEYVWTRRAPRWDLVLQAVVFIAFAVGIAWTWWVDDVMWAVVVFSIYAFGGLAFLVAALLGYTRVRA